MSKPFKFKKSPRRARPEKPKGYQYTKKTQDPPQGLIQGQIPGSNEEWLVSLALDRLGLRYTYQYSINGGASVAGGQIIDFVVWTVPAPTPVEVQGDYWHSSGDEVWKMEQIKQAFHGQEPILLWDYEFSTVDEAVTLLRTRRIT